MATVTLIPFALPADRVPTKTMVRDIIGAILTREWPHVDPDTLTMSYHASYANGHCRVQRPRPDAGTPVETLGVFIKFHNDTEAGLEAFHGLAPNRHQEAQICHEYAQSGQGAAVYAFFETRDGTLGRIDELLDARCLEPADVEDAAIRADVAKAMAAFHAMEMSSRRKQPVEQYYEAVMTGLDKYHKLEKLKALGRAVGADVDRLVDFDFAARLQKVVDKLESLGAKKSWCIHDVQFMNVMVKNSPKPGESKVVLIDFEMVMHDYRAFDIGGHFMQKLFKWFDEESKIAHCAPYTDDEKRHFCSEYAQEWNSATGDSDTGDQVFLESEYGYMLAIAFDLHNMLWYMEAHDDDDLLNIAGLQKLHGEFDRQYAKLGLQDP